MAVDDTTTLDPASVIVRGDERWEQARRFHSGIGEPAAIISARSLDEVSGAVHYAAAERLDVMIRSGGHSAWGGVPGGLTLDISALAAVDVEGDLVRVGGGARWGDVARALVPHALGISSGDTASVGVGGLTLGGGIGWMVRAWGLAADQLVGVQLVTPRAEVLEVTDASHPDLMWALRGGGGNFGVVTRFDFRAHPLRAVVAITLGLDGGSDARVVLAALRDLMADAPRQLTVTYMDVPAMDPSAPAGATITGVWIGDDERAATAALAPLLALEGVTVRESGVRAYPDVLLESPAFDPDEPMPGFVGGNSLIVDLSAESIDRLVAFRAENEASVLFLRSLGGAYSDVAQADTPFPARDATWFAMAGVFDIPGMLGDAARAKAVADWAEIEALGAGVYGNFTTSTEPEWSSRMYPAATMARLAAVKKRWDPTNMFCRNHNVSPG